MFMNYEWLGLLAGQLIRKSCWLGQENANDAVVYSGVSFQPAMKGEKSMEVVGRIYFYKF